MIKMTVKYMNLLISKKYSDEILHARHGAQDTENEKLVEDIQPKITCIFKPKADQILK